jgi:hypothetical protein
MLCVRKTDLGSWPLWTQYLHKPYNNSIGVAIDYMTCAFLHSSIDFLETRLRYFFIKYVDTNVSRSK